MNKFIRGNGTKNKIKTILKLIAINLGYPLLPNEPKITPIIGVITIISRFNLISM